MPTTAINDIEDPRLADYQSLKKTNLTRYSKKFIVEGRTLVERLLQSSFQVHSVVSTPAMYAGIKHLIDDETVVFLVDKHLINGLVGFEFHRGALACAARKEATPILSLDRDEPSTIVVCPKIVDQTNLGGVIRSCAAFGVAAVVVGGRSADPFSRRVVRVSMGTVFTLPIVQPDDLQHYLSQLKETHRYELIATVLDSDAELLPKSKRATRTALLFGSEGYGLEEEWIAMSHRKVTLPMKLGTDSLNLSTSCGVFLYHFMIQAS